MSGAATEKEKFISSEFAITPKKTYIKTRVPIIYANNNFFDVSTEAFLPSKSISPIINRAGDKP